MQIEAPVAEQGLLIKQIYIRQHLGPGNSSAGIIVKKYDSIVFIPQALHNLQVHPVRLKEPANHHQDSVPVAVQTIIHRAGVIEELLIVMQEKRPKRVET